MRDEDDDDRCRRESCEFRLLKRREIVFFQFMGTNQVVVSRQPVPGCDSSIFFSFLVSRFSLFHR